MKFDENVIVFDTETTGLTPESDEILQLSIINGKGKVLFNKYFKPEHKTSWERAESIHGISPKKVRFKKRFSYYKDTIQSIFENADTIIAYNGKFDIKFLEAAGIECFKMSKEQPELFSESEVPPRTKDYRDPMIEFADIYGEYSEKLHSNKFKKLVDAANYYGYSFDAHDSLEDVKATLFIAKKIYGEN